MKRLITLSAILGMLLVSFGSAAITTVLPTDLYVQGNISSKTMTVAAGAISNAQVASGAGIAATKVQHAHRAIFAQGSATTAASATQVFYVVVGATSTLHVAEAGAVVAPIGTDTVAIDIKKNNVSVLSAPISLTNSLSARGVVLGTIATPGGVSNDVYEVIITPTHSTGTLPTGVFVVLDVYEDPS